MLHKMRRFKQLLPENESKDILCAGSNGVLSLVDDDGRPYGVPLSYVYDGDGAIYFHSARDGRKIDCLSYDPRCSFCVIAQDDVKPVEFTTYFKSVIVSGRIAIVVDRDEIERALQILSKKYSPGIDCQEEIAKCLNRVAVLRFDIESMTGKEAIELTKMRKN